MKFAFIFYGQSRAAHYVSPTINFISLFQIQSDLQLIQLLLGNRGR